MTLPLKKQYVLLLLTALCQVEVKYTKNLEVRHPRCVGLKTKNFVYYTYS